MPSARLALTISLSFAATTALASDEAEVRSDCFSRTNAPDARVVACQTLVSAYPDIRRNEKILLRAHNTLGLALCDARRGGEAVPHFEWVLRHNNTIAGYFENYSRALRDAGRYDDSLVAVNRAIRMAPNYAFVYNGKAHTFEAMGNYEAAFRVLEKAFDLDSHNSGLFEYRGKLLGLMHRYDEAQSDFTRAREIDPTNSHVYKTRGEMEIAQGKIDEGVADLRQYPVDSEDIDEVRVEINDALHPDHEASPEPAPLTVRPDAQQQATEKAQRDAEAADERAKKAEAEAQAIRDLEAAKAREKAAQEAKEKAEKDQAEAQRAEDARKKAETEPVNVLSKGYAFYIATKRCHETRDGYATVWINDVEISKAKQEIATIEKRLDPDNKLDRDAAWKFANGQIDKLAPVLDDKTCHEALAEVDSLFKKVDPDAAMTRKDF